LAGGVLIGTAVVLALYSGSYVMDGEQELEISKISVLKEYADAMRWSDNHKALYRKPLTYYLDYPLDFNPKNVYQSNIYTLRARANTLSNLIVELYNYGYIQECSNCQKRLCDYYGWTFAEYRYLNGANRTVLLDAEKRRVSAVPIIVDVYRNTQADKLGLEEGDIIESVNGNSVIYPEDLTANLSRPVKGSEKITIAVRRMNKRLEFTATGGDLGVQIWYINADYLK
jgi:C-terminal processing protease CtpA/Prc